MAKMIAVHESIKRWRRSHLSSGSGGFSSESNTSTVSPRESIKLSSSSGVEGVVDTPEILPHVGGGVARSLPPIGVTLKVGGRDLIGDDGTVGAAGDGREKLIALNS